MNLACLRGLGAENLPFDATLGAKERPKDFETLGRHMKKASLFTPSL